MDKPSDSQDAPRKIRGLKIIDLVQPLGLGVGENGCPHPPTTLSPTLYSEQTYFPSLVCVCPHGGSRWCLSQQASPPHSFPQVSSTMVIDYHQQPEAAQIGVSTRGECHQKAIV